MTKLVRTLRGALIADPLIILATIGFGTVSLIVSLFDNSGRLPIGVARWWARTLLLVSGVRVKVSGLENINPHESYVFVANHSSYMDTPVALANIPVQFRFLAKHGLFQIPFLGQHLSHAGHIPVFRNDPRAAVKTLGMAAEAIQQKRISLLTFPEGGRSRDGNLQPFKDGAAHIAIKAGVPIVPLALKGVRKLLPLGAGIVRAGTVELHVLPPLTTRGANLRERGVLTERVRQSIQDELAITKRQEQWQPSVTIHP